MKNKLYVLKVDEDHFWLSCNIIQKYICEALDRAPFEVHYIDPAQVDSILPESDIFFMSDHFKWQDSLSALLGKKNHFILPVYGNMTVELDRWNYIGDNLLGENVSLLAASPRSKDQIQSLVQSGACHIVPYPMKPSIVTSSAGKSLIYAGRLTPQKNILELMSVFINARRFNSQLKLHIAGDFHDRGYHLHGYKVDMNVFKDTFYSLIKKSDGGIEYHGSLEQGSLEQVMGNCQYSVSMSTYHDEDFGVSIAQGFLKGHQLVLSNWGGHGAYNDFSDMVGVEVDEDLIPRINKKNLLSALMGLKGRVNSIVDHDLSTQLSYESFNLKISEIIQQKNEYLGQSQTFRLFSKTYRKSFPFRKKSGKSLYREVYSSYTGFEIK